MCVCVCVCLYIPMLYNAIFGEIWKNVYTQDMKSMTQIKNTLKSNLVSQWDRGYLEEYKVYLQEQEQLKGSCITESCGDAEEQRISRSKQSSGFSAVVEYLSGSLTGLSLHSGS